MLAPVLRSRRRQGDGRGVEVDLAPTQRSDLITPSAAKHQQLDDRAVLSIAHRTPDRGKLVIGQDPFTRAVLDRLVGEGDRIAST